MSQPWDRHLLHVVQSAVQPPYCHVDCHFILNFLLLLAFSIGFVKLRFKSRSGLGLGSLPVLSQPSVSSLSAPSQLSQSSLSSTVRAWNTLSCLILKPSLRIEIPLSLGFVILLLMDWKSCTSNIQLVNTTYGLLDKACVICCDKFQLSTHWPNNTLTLY